MRTFLGIFMVLFVSGDDEMIETITGVIGDSVLLPCNCTERNMDKLFKWQVEEPNKTLVLKHMTSYELYGRYKDRVQIFLPENSNNCSILLTNITAADLGKYRCSFYRQEPYKKVFVYLNISASYSVCEKEDPSLNLFQCDVRGHYEEADIQWNLNGQLLTDSTTTRITHAKTLDPASHLYNFTSNLTTKLNSTSKPKCNVKAKGLSTIISPHCTAVSDSRRDIIIPSLRHRYIIIIPFSIFVLGICLVLWHHLKLSQKTVERSGEKHNLVVMA